MSLKKYLSAISPASFGAVSETALYTPIATHILSGILGYAPKHYAINKSGAKGTPDIRIFSGEDGSEWIVCEAKLRDTDIRKGSSRRRICKEQIVERGYIRAETFYVQQRDGRHPIQVRRTSTWYPRTLKTSPCQLSATIKPFACMT